MVASVSSGAVIIDLGEWAEDQFSSLCSLAGVTRNKAIQDRTGWDYIIEFPSPPMPLVPADLRPPEKSTRVQIKSKRSGKPSVSLKLSNALRFAKDSLPCFVVLFIATKSREPVRVFARHFWEKEIGQALLRARQAHAEGRNDLNKLSISLSFGVHDEHTDDLMAWMAAQIPSYIDQYTRAKGELVRTLGFEDGSIHGNIQFKSEDLEALVDHQIGLTPNAPIMSVTIKERRFGIDSVMPLIEGAPAFARMQSHPRACRVRVRGTVGHDAWLDGNLYFPGVPDLPRELVKTRIVADFIEILISGTEAGQVSFRVGRLTQRSLSGLRVLANVLQAAKDGPLDVQINVDSRVLFEFSVSVPVTVDSDRLQQLSYVIECLEKTSAGLLPLPGLTLSLADIDQAWNQIVEFNGLVNGTGLKAKFTLTRELQVIAASVRWFFACGYVDVGDWTFMAVVRRPILNFEMHGTVGSFECGEPRVAEAIVRLGKGSDHLSELRDLYSRAVKTDPAGVIELCGGDFRAMNLANS